MCYWFGPESPPPSLFRAHQVSGKLVPALPLAGKTPWKKSVCFFHYPDQATSQSVTVMHQRDL